jgi:ABC-2 type transport system permease protein
MHLVRTELRKQRTVRTFLLGWAVAPVIAALTTIAIFSTAGRDGNDPLDADSLTHVIGAPFGVVTIVALLLGVLGMAGEYRHQTITTTLLASPRRHRVVMAKIVAHGASGALIAVASAAVTFAIAVPWLRAGGIPVELTRELLRVVVGGITATALYGALGVAVAAIVKNQTAACAAALVWLLAIEGILGDLFAGSAFVEWLPSDAARALVHVGPRASALSVPVAGVVLVTYVAALAAVGTRSLRRDVV